MKTSVINIAGAVLLWIYRTVFANRVSLLYPAMSDNLVWYGQVGISALQVLLTLVIFRQAYKKLDHYRKLIPDEDYQEMAKLQQEFNKDNISTLSSGAIDQLLRIWGVILIGVRLIYDISGIVYRKFIVQISQIAVIGELLGETSLVEIYNNSHGFKYIGMFIAVVLGTMMTAIFLKDRLLQLISVGITVIFMAAFVVVNMGDISLFGFSVGIVWTSIIFHACETVGLLALAYYLERKYKGI